MIFCDIFKCIELSPCCGLCVESFRPRDGVVVVVAVAEGAARRRARSTGAWRRAVEAISGMKLCLKLSDLVLCKNCQEFIKFTVRPKFTTQMRLAAAADGHTPDSRSRKR